MRAILALTVICSFLPAPAAEPHFPPDVRPLDWDGDIASRLVDAADAFLLRELDRTAERCDEAWTPWAEGRDAVLAARRKRLAHILGLRDARVAANVELLATPDRDSVVAAGDGYKVHAVRWAVLDGVTAEGLLLVPDGPP